MLRNWTRWIAYPIVMVVVLLVATIPHAIARSDQVDATTNRFVITHFDADYVLERQPDGTTDVLVTERIEARFDRDRTNRGILRALPLRYQDHRNTITDVEVTGEVHTESERYTYPPEKHPGDTGTQKFTRTEDDGVVVLRIGDPQRYLTRGPQAWVIRYRLGDVALNTPDRQAQEIYLDVNGTGWEVPFRRVTARLHVPAEFGAHLTGTTACYQGPEGSTTPCREITTDLDGDTTVVTATARSLDRRSGLTFAVGFDTGTFPVAYTPHREAWPWWLFVLPAIGLLFYGITFIRYLRNRGVGRPRVLVTEYLPPDGVPVIAAADIMGRPEKGPTAQLIALVESGELRLRTYNTPADRPDGPPKPLGFFGRRRLRKALDIERNDFDAIEDEGVRDLMQGYFGYGLDYQPPPEAAADLAEKQQDLVVRRGWREWGPQRPTWFGFTMVCFLLVGGIGMYAIHPRGQDFWWALLSGALGIVLLVAALYRHPSFGPLTGEGQQIRNHLLGLKHFISLSEENRITWLQGVASAPRVQADDHSQLVKLYEPLLPYAIIFGLEKSWTAVLGEHQRVVPGGTSWLGPLQTVPLGDVVRTIDHTTRHRGHRTLGGFRALTGTNEAIGQGFRSVGEVMGDAMTAMQNSSNDGGGSRGGGGSSSWSSGGSRGGGRSGGGMGGGGGGGW